MRQSSSACSHAAPVGAAGRPSRYANVVSSGAIIPARAPASIDMLQIVIRFSIDRPRIASPVYSSTCPIPPATPSRPIAPRIMSFAVTFGRQLALEADAHRARPCLGQALRREHVLDLRRADAERERAERAVRRGVAVAADDRHPRLRQPELRADHVDDPFAAAAGREERNAELLAVAAQGVELRLGERIGDRALLGRDVVVHRRDRQIRPPDAPAGEPQAVEGLGRGDLVDQVQVDEERWPARPRARPRDAAPRSARTGSSPSAHASQAV